MKTILKIFIVIITAYYSHAQIEPEWIVRYESSFAFERAYDIATDNFGNIYVAGTVGTASQFYDFITIKYNSHGEQQWVQTYNGPGNSSDFATAIEIDPLGNVYVTGSSDGGSSDEDYATIKYNSEGVLQWIKRYNGAANRRDEPTGIAVDTSGNVFVTGSSAAINSNQSYSNDYVTVKYSSDGAELWVRSYNGIGDNSDSPTAIAVDHQGNIFITGNSWIDETANSDIVTLKYSSAGNLLWSKRYNGPVSGNDIGYDIAVDHLGNVYVTGGSVETVSPYMSAYVTIKYSTGGAELWVQRWSNFPGNGGGYATGIVVDTESNIYVTGIGSSAYTLKYNYDGLLMWDATPGAGHNYSIGVDNWDNVYVTGYAAIQNEFYNWRTIKYNSDGDQEWLHYYNGTASLNDKAYKLAIDGLGNVYVTGESRSASTFEDITTIRYPGDLLITQPSVDDKWIAGEVDTIKWNGGQSGQFFQIEFSTDNGNIYETIGFGFPADSGYYIWELPDTVLTTKAKIKLTDMVNNQLYIESETFRIKPYVLTRIDENGDYYEYRKNRDQWGFSNIQSDIWPASWFIQFNYQGIDPFTGSQYSQWQADGSFSKANFANHPDWISWVNTFSVDACYFSTTLGIYRSAAVEKWTSIFDNWNGSCFGIAAANTLAFGHREEFNSKYSNYPTFINPITVASDPGVKSVVNELFTHQYGNPSKANDVVGNAKTPNQTLDDIRQMLIEDTSIAKTLTIFNNGGSGGHTILAYGLKQDTVQKNLYYVYVYDNSNPNSNNPITIDTSANGGTGSWSTSDWAGWGGTTGIYLEIPSVQYLNGATSRAHSNSQSAFVLPQNVLEINYPSDTPIRIIDNQGNITGYFNNLALNEIPGSLPQMIRNGSESPPYGYSLPTDSYSVVLNVFEEDTVQAFLFTSNKSFVYERSGATQTQTDRLFFDGGLSVVNPDANTKTVQLLNIINETTQEKLTSIKSIELVQSDSVKIENPDSNKVKLISFGSAKDYDIELNYVTENGLGRFGDFNIPLSANTSHTFVPEWTNLTNSPLVVLVDIGNNGTIDDTLYINNTVDVEDRGSLLSPDSYNLTQNYPNPFNPVTTIQYSIPQRSNVTLKVYDIIGNEVATLVNEEKERGVFSVRFDASNLASGIYFYRLQAGSFVETKKMILLK